MPTDLSNPIWACDICRNRFGANLAAAQRCEAAGPPVTLPDGELILLHDDSRHTGNRHGWRLGVLHPRPKIRTKATEWDAGAAGHLATYDIEGCTYDNRAAFTSAAGLYPHQAGYGVWHRWWSCQACDGNGGPRASRCQVAVPRHRGWYPASAVSSGAMDTPEFLFGVGPGHAWTGRPLRQARCRHCRFPVTSGCGPCRGDRHICPVIVPAESSATASQVYGQDYWRCSQPGQMNDDFTGWTCALGHVTTRERHPSHDPYGKGDAVCGSREIGCPFDYLASRPPAAGTLNDDSFT
jgi:hypothetical protein